MAKQWAWSYSKFKNYFVCPKRHYEVDIAKHFNDSSEQLTWGNSVHDALKDATLGKAPLPDSMSDYQHWVDEMKSGVFRDDDGEPMTRPVWMRHLSAPKSVLEVEQKYAITKDFQGTTWFGNNVWFRGICDAVRFDPTKTVGLARDYKTGKVQHDSRQLMLMATCIFNNTPSLRLLRTEFIWLKDDCKTEETFHRNTIMNEWPPILTGVQEMIAADVAQSYPPKPGRLCGRYCPVISCPFHGKRHS